MRLPHEELERAALEARLAGAGDYPETPKPARRRSAGESRFGPVELAEAVLQEGAHFAVDAGGRLHVFEDGRYRPTGEDYIRRAAKPILARAGKAKAWRSAQCDEAARWIATDAPRLWDRPPVDLVNVRNGLLDIRQGVLKPHDPAYLSPVQIEAAFDPKATCPAWDAFVESTLPADSKELAWQLCAWLMMAETSIQKAVLLTGEGANGKSVFLRALIAFLGARNVSNVALHRLESDRFSVARLLGRLANIFADLPASALEGTSTFKALVGGDPLMAEFKHRDAFEFQPFARLLFSANHPPRSPDASAAFFRRWLVIPFERTFSDGASGTMPAALLDEALAHPDELAGVLNRALLYAADLRDRGIVESETTRAALEEFRETTDPLAVWLDRQTVKSAEGVIDCDGLYQGYARACNDSGRPVLSKQAFGRVVRRLRPSVEVKQKSVNGCICWCYAGLRWREAA